MDKDNDLYVKKAKSVREILNEAFLGKTRYDNISFTYEEDAKFFIVKRYMENLLKEKNAFDNVTDINSLFSCIENKFQKAIFSCLYISPELEEQMEEFFEKFENEKNDKKILKYLMKKRDNNIYKYFFDKKLVPLYGFNIEKSSGALFFLDFILSIEKFNSNIPGEMFPVIIDFIKYMISGFSKFLSKEDVANIIKNCKFYYDKSSLLKINPEVSKHIELNDRTLLIKNIYFNKYQDIQMYTELLGNECNIYDNTVIQNCVFNEDILRNLTKVKGQVFFYDCRFYNRFRIFRTKPGTIFYFIKCRFYGRAEFGGNASRSYMPYTLVFEDCSFEEGSLTTFSNIQEQAKEENGDDSVTLIDMNRSIVDGMVKFSNISKASNIGLLMSEVAFFNQFVFEDCYLASNSTFSDLAFNSNGSQLMENSINQFAKCLIASGFGETAEKLNLVKSDNGNADADVIDMQSYKLECDSGFLKPKYAAYYLGMSKDNLAKKRMADKKQITRETIPYVGKGKSIAYPLEALKAFKASDWTLLKELRERYRKE